MRLFVFICMVLAVHTSCKPRLQQVPQPVVIVLRDTTATTDQLSQEAGKGDSLIISFDRTPCFGRCPVYKIKVYESGFAIYEGLNFTERMGIYSTRISDDKIGKVYEMALQIGYWELDSLYDNPYVSDLPSTVIQLRREGELKRVVSRVGAPEKLSFFIDNATTLLYESRWELYDLH